MRNFSLLAATLLVFNFATAGCGSEGEIGGDIGVSEAELGKGAEELWWLDLWRQWTRRSSRRTSSSNGSAQDSSPPSSDTTVVDYDEGKDDLEIHFERYATRTQSAWPAERLTVDYEITYRGQGSLDLPEDGSDYILGKLQLKVQGTDSAGRAYLSSSTYNGPDNDGFYGAGGKTIYHDGSLFSSSEEKAEYYITGFDIPTDGGSFLFELQLLDINHSLLDEVEFNIEF